MKKNSLIFYLILLGTFIIPCSFFAQVSHYALETEDYVVISFNRTRNNETRVFYWVLKCKEIGNKKLYPVSLLLNDGYNIGIPAKIDSALLKRINYPAQEKLPLFNGDFLNDADGFEEKDGELANSLATRKFVMLVKKHRKEIQRISKQWEDKTVGIGIEDLSRKNEEIIVYATPVSGKFEKGWKYSLSEAPDYVYSNYAYRPTEDINYNDNFWETDQGLQIKYSDFSYMKFWENSVKNSSSGDNLGFSVYEPF